MDFSQVKNKADSNEITRAYLDGLLVESRYLNSCVPDTTLELYGKTFDSPIMIAAFSHLNPWHENGMAEIAKGAKQAGICNWAGMGDQAELYDVLQTGAQTIKIVKPYADRKMVFDRLTHAHENGALAVGMDIDHSYDKHGQVDCIHGIHMAPVSTEELRSFVQATPLPFVVKGVLSVQDAEQCVAAGASGIVISHHHGILPCGVPPLMMLPSIRAAVGDKLDIFVDCGMETGFDAFKALALGATAVCVSRGILDALKAEGAQGVAAHIATMNDQLRSLMAKTGTADLSKMSADVLWNGCTETNCGR